MEPDPETPLNLDELFNRLRILCSEESKPAPAPKGATREGWMAVVFNAEQLQRELARLEHRNRVLERRLRLLVEVGQGAIDADQAREETEGGN